MKNKIFKLSCYSLLLASVVACSANKPVKVNEAWYQSRWCERQKGEAEVRLQDNTRVDCVTYSYAIEVDFARKWAESIGQSLHYAKLTGKQAGILLIVETDSDERNLQRLNELIEYHRLPIRVWTTNQTSLR